MSAFIVLAGILTGCNKPVKTAQAAISEMTDQDYILEGKKLVLIGGCTDCHSPKTFDNGIMGTDESRFLAGHPQDSPLPPIDTKSLEPGNWLSFSPDLTAFIGPWGMSYARNLTPHETGIKGWTLDVFIKAMRTGKHMGVEQGRPIMPPMPWEIVGELPDEDLKAIYFYLMSIPPVDNRVPDPLSPDEVRALAAGA
ncbi:MAG: c-type cytochrome [Cyclobacteriaceae bacterium]